MTVVKIKYGSDIRKSAVHNNDLTLNDLLLMAQRIFNISPQEPFTLKYKDSDGDLITLAEDSDLRLALDTNSSDTLSVFVNGDNVAAETLKAQFSQLQSDFERLLNAINSAEVRHNASHPEPTQPLKVNGDHGYGHQHASPEPSPAPEIAPPATIQATYNEKSLNNFQHNHNESLSAIEDEIPLGAEAASVASSHHVSHMNVSSIVSPHGEPPAQYQQQQQQQQQTFSPPASVPSYPPQPMGHPPAAYPEPTPPAPQQYNNNPQYGQQAPPPPVPGGFPPSGGPPSNTPFAPVPQYGGQPPNTPASNAPPAGNPPFSGPPTNFGQAPQQQVPPPPGPPQQFGQPGQPLGGYPGAQPGYQPMGFSSSQAPPVPEPSHQYGAPPSFPGGHGAPPPSAFPPGSQGPPMGAPPMMPPSGMPPGANPFARGPAPPTGYRQSPYHQ